MTRNREAGQALVAVAVSLVVLLMAAGLGIDMGYLRYERRRAQTAADSAAITGAAETKYNASIDEAVLADATTNGFHSGFNGVTVTPNPVNCPDGSAGCIQVVVSQSVPTFFMRIAGSNFSNVTISASATAKLGSGMNCVYAGSGGVNLTGGTGSYKAVVTANSCGVLSDQNISLAYVSADHLTASSIGYGNSCTTNEGNCAGGNFSPVPSIIVPTNDPLSYLPPQSSPGACSSGIPYQISGTQTLSPGSYPCGIQILTNANVTFQSGLYTLGSPSGNIGNESPLQCIPASPCLPPLPSGNLTCANDSGTATTPGSGPTQNMCPSLASFLIAGNNITVTGKGVTFYSSSGAVAICAADANSTNDGTGCNPDWGLPPNIDLEAPTSSATYPAVLFFQDRSNQAPATIAGADDPVNGSQSTFIEGGLYFGDAALTLYDLSDINWADTYTILDAKTINFLGVVQLGGDFAALPNGSPISDAVLVK